MKTAIKLNIDIGNNHTEGTFLKRLNRFVAQVKVNGKIYHAHLHDSGRLGELLIPGSPIMLIPKKSPKTDFKVIAIHREGYGWVLLNSGVHRYIVEDILRRRLIPEFKDLVSYTPEYKVGNHRIDFFLDFGTHTALMEVKGCSLFEGKTCLFPDSPTKRGAEHLLVLSEHPPAYLLFVVCHPSIQVVKPNCKEDPIFCDAFKKAVQNGVIPLAVKVEYKNSHIYFSGTSPI